MRKFNTIAASFHRIGVWTSAECAAIFGRLIVETYLDGELTEHLAESWGRSAGHYGRLALAEQEALAEHVLKAVEDWKTTNAQHWKEVTQ